MGSEKKPSLPGTPDLPTYKESDVVTQRTGELYGLGGQAAKGDFSGDLSWLKDTTEYSPEMTSLFLKGLKAQLDPVYEDMRRESINRLAASNQLESSVLPSTLADIEKNQMNQYIQQSTAFGINDINRAMQNKMSLFGTGLNTMQYGSEAERQREAAKNTFNLQNFQNAMSKWDADAASQMYSEKNKGGGFMGAITGALGGAMSGFTATGNPLGAIAGAGLGGFSGYSTPGAGSSWLGTGLSGWKNPFSKVGA